MITAETVAYLGPNASTEGAALAVPVLLKYDQADPLAVRLIFQGNEQVEWVFARDLLADGLNGRVGEGDVVIGPFKETIIGLVLRNATETAKFALLRMDIMAFVSAIYDAVPRGEESLDLDSWLSSLSED